MSLKSHRWRKCLLGTTNDIYQLRTIKLSIPLLEDLPVVEIDRDLTRTFPLEMFYTNHIDKIRNVLLWYAWTNPSLPYCQCFSFLAFVMYGCFHQGDKRHAMIDTYYAIHKMILLIKPLLPISANDTRPLEFAGILRSVILLDIMKYDRQLYNRLRNSIVIKYVIFSGFSAFYLNWFDSASGITLLDYIINEKSSVMFQRLLKFTVAFFLVQKPMFMGLEDDQCLELLHEKEMINFYSILWKAKSLD